MPQGFFLDEGAQHVTSPNTTAEQVAEWHRQAMHALQQQRGADAAAAWTRILALSPADARAHAGLGRWAHAQGDLQRAAHHLTHAATASRGNSRPWIDVALVHEQRGDAFAQEGALHQALKEDPQDLLALLMRAALYERTGRMAQAVDVYIAATMVAPPMAKLAPDLREPMAHAFALRQDHEQRLAAFVDQALEPALSQAAGEDLARFRLSVDILLGRKRRHDSQPMRYFVPQLMPVEFFDRSRFPWLAAMEAGTDRIRSELLTVLQDNQDITPYLQYAEDQPVEQWAELNRNPRWSAYHLWKDGRPVAEHVARCPETALLLEATPRPHQPGRTPVAMFSLLKPKTVIPPHVGASNARLICHLPLIVPPGCHFRVGNSVREWVVGQAWVFDDTIEHEAHNTSDQLRAILIWDTWHPDLQPHERVLISALNAALNDFGGADASFVA